MSIPTIGKEWELSNVMRGSLAATRLFTSFDNGRSEWTWEQQVGTIVTVVTKKYLKRWSKNISNPKFIILLVIFNDIHLYATKVMKLEFSHNIDVGSVLISTTSTEIRVTQAVVATWTSFIRHDQACSNPIFAGGTQLVLLPDPETTLRETNIFRRLENPHKKKKPGLFAIRF